MARLSINGEAGFPRRLVYPINALPSVQTIEAGIHEILWDADLKFEALRRYYQNLDADVLFYFSDIVIQAEAMGAEIAFSNGGMPAVKSPAGSIEVPKPGHAARMQINARVVSRMQQEFPGKYIAAPVFGPFTVAGQVVGEEALLRMLVDDRGAVMDLLEKALEVAGNYTQFLVDAGANVVSVADPLSALIPPDQFWEFAGDFLQRLFDPFNALPTILHICGDTAQVVDQMVKTGVGGVSFDNCMDLMAFEDQIPDDVSIIGNIDPVSIVERGSLEDIASETADLVSMMALKRNFVLSTGCAVPFSAPLENVRCFVETGRRRFAELEPAVPQLSEISAHVFSAKAEEAVKGVQSALERGVDPLVIVTSGLTRAVRKGSALYEAKKCFLPSLLLMVDAFYEGFRLLEDRLHNRGAGKTDVILGTVKGDIHEIGKNLVRIFFEIYGYQVVDLGVDVSAEAFLESYGEHHPKLIGLSAFTTKSKEEMGKIINALRQKGKIDAQVIVGGAALNESAAQSLGADGFAPDAVRAVGLAKGLLRQAKSGPQPS
ncbi:methyltransferase, MtaA/CmuA family [Desulfatibacillum alkenivorans DSM 16219]|jgi:MtaA/CmuA family methyltransferase|uniref:Methyltransferase, MtaA/CmuA family n=1 Tax=Desulfatibacillum alkenivorans DSM 16219 TaxID=1121393 RepID=A0A1M6GF72_9BACT|nr:uroporphyrinogen decarboxylase family protein [Desulfatibacillum alkenivorans]SHJ08605.1 methyltransferase, MtaA/CmuA family [Desulfatibacillum alkenivorans DSM 16219]